MLSGQEKSKTKTWQLSSLTCLSAKKYAHNRIENTNIAIIIQYNKFHAHLNCQHTYFLLKSTDANILILT